ncbi:MAG: hypothetical protein Q8L48_33135 [Archangium sp.]|nr:hypothetical protein [Archangium sp.]
MRRLRWSFPLLVLLACGGAPERPDAAFDDAGADDAGAGDAGALDSGGADSGAKDPPDAGPRPTLVSLALEVDLTLGRAISTSSWSFPDGGDCAYLSAPPLDRVRWGAADAVVSRDGGLLVACGAPQQPIADLTAEGPLAAPLAPGTDQGFAVRQGRVGRFTSVLSWVEGCGRLVACDPHPALQVPIHFTVIHAPDERVLCPGRVSAAPRLTTCAPLAPTPSYSGLLLVAATSWQSALLAQTDAGVVTLHDAPGSAVRQALDPAEVSAALDWFTATLGPLPYGPELQVAAGPLTWLGFEGPGLILLSEEAPDLMLPWTAGTLHAFEHELAHQWAGDRTTLVSAADFTVKETLAEYLVFRFEEDRAPPRALETRAYWRRTGLFASTWPRPVGPALPPLIVLAADGTGSGPMVLLQLEPLLGRDAVLRAVQAVLRAPGAIGWDELRVALEQQSGQALRGYFDAWAFGSGEPDWPVLSAALRQDAAGWFLEVRQSSPSGRRYPMQVALEVELSSGARVPMHADFPLEQTPGLVRVALPEAPAAWTIDPDRRLLWWPDQAPLVRPWAPAGLVF